MVMNQLRKAGISSNLAYLAGLASIVASIATWRASKDMETAERDRADRWGIFVGLWAPTFIGIGNALRHDETK
jgi:hypothetical protein